MPENFSSGDTGLPLASKTIPVFRFGFVNDSENKKPRLNSRYFALIQGFKLFLKHGSNAGTGTVECVRTIQRIVLEVSRTRVTHLINKTTTVKRGSPGWS